MKLFLCGGGSGKKIEYALNMFSNTIDKGKPILYIPLAMDYNKYNDCYTWFKTEMEQININNFEMITTSLELSEKNLNSYSAIFIGGGNTYKLLDELKKNNNIQKIKEYLKKDGILFGSSAGAIIFGKDINSAALDDENKIGIKDTAGFNYLNNYSILCHLNSENFDKNLEYLKKYSIKNKLIYLSEDNVIYVYNNKFNIMGKNKYVIFENGIYNYDSKGE